MRYACVPLLAALMICSSIWANDRRLVAQYSFDEGGGTQAKDVSGKGSTAAKIQQLMHLDRAHGNRDRRRSIFVASSPLNLS